MQRHILRQTIFFVAVILALVGQTWGQVTNPEIQAALETGNTKKAIELLKAEIAADPNYHLNYYLLGKVYYEAGNYAEASDQFQTALDKKSKHWESLYYLSQCLIELNQLDRAEKAIKRGLKKAKHMTAQFENALGLLNLSRKDFQEADRAFRRALATSEKNEEKQLRELKSAPYSEADRQRAKDSLKAMYRRQNAQYHINLGDANYFSGVPSLAIAEYEKALQVDTGSTDVYYHWAEACLKIPDYQCAIEKLKIVLTKDSMHAPAWMRAAGIYYKAARSQRSRSERKERYIEAIGSYEKYLELSGAKPDSSSVRVFFELAMAYSGLSRFEDAVPYFEKVLSIPFIPKDIYFYYGKALFWTKQYTKAGEFLLKHIEWAKQQDAEYKSSVKDFELYRLLGDSYFYRKPKDYPNAVKYYVKSLETRPEQKRLLRNTAVSYYYMKSYTQALEYYDRRIKLGIDSSSSSIYKNAGFCALNVARGQGDEEDLGLLDGEESGGSQGGADISGADADTDYYDIALNYLRKYLDFNATDKKALLLVANTYLYQMSDCTNGVAFFEKLLAVDSSNCAALKAIGYAYFAGVCTTNYTKSLKYLHKAYNCLAGSDEGPCSDPEVSKLIAQAYHLRAVKKSGAAAKSDYKNAFDWYGKCLKCNPGDADCQKGQDDTRFEF